MKQHGTGIQHATGRRQAAAAAALLLAIFVPAMAQAPAPVTVVTPERGAVVDRRSLSGSLVSLRSASLSPRLAGVVESIAVEAGDRVARGDAVLQLDDDLARLEARRAEAAASEGRVRLEEARRVRDESAELADRRNIARTQARAAAAEAEISAAAMARLQAEAALQRELLERHALQAPFDGVVAARLVDVGEWVEPGTPVIELVADQALRFDIRAPQELWHAIAVGDAAGLRFDPLPGRRFEGRVEGKVPAQDAATRSFLLRVVPDAPDPALTVGMSGEASFALAERSRALTLPRDAVLRYPDGTTGVWVVESADGGTVARARPVELGALLGERVEVRAGLEGGERVVLRGNERLRDGEAVRIVDGG